MTPSKTLWTLHQLAKTSASTEVKRTRRQASQRQSREQCVLSQQYDILFVRRCGDLANRSTKYSWNRNAECGTQESPECVNGKDILITRTFLLLRPGPSSPCVRTGRSSAPEHQIWMIAGRSVISRCALSKHAGSSPPAYTGTARSRVVANLCGSMTR